MSWIASNLMTLVSLAAVVAYLAPFILLQTGRLSAESPLYSVLNLLGAGLILCTMVHQFNLASFISNSIWVAFSLYGLMKAVRKPPNPY